MDPTAPTVAPLTLTPAALTVETVIAALEVSGYDAEDAERDGTASELAAALAVESYWRGAYDGITGASPEHCHAATRRAYDQGAIYRYAERYTDGLVAGMLAAGRTS